MSDAAERFWAQVDKSGDCWLWTGPTNRRYGSFYYAGRTVRAHRMSWLLTHGEIPAGLLVCHHCDNPPCVRPDHLFVGTMSDNINDAVRKGRHRMGMTLGTDVCTAKVNDEIVREIRRLWAEGGNQRHIARRFGIDNTTVSLIVCRKSWKHVIAALTPDAP